MQTFGNAEKDAIFNAIISDDYWTETMLSIDGIAYYEDTIKSVESESETVSTDKMVGNAVAASIKIQMHNPSVDIPRMAVVNHYIRVSNGHLTSDYMQMGSYRVDTRKVAVSDTGNSILTLTGYDAMLTAEQAYSSKLVFPAKDLTVVQDIATQLGLTVDPRTVALMNMEYPVQLPSQYTMRETLGYIAAMYAGNFIINPVGQLRLIRLNEMPKETNYLISDHFDTITFGGVKILV